MQQNKGQHQHWHSVPEHHFIWQRPDTTGPAKLIRVESIAQVRRDLLTHQRGCERRLRHQRTESTGGLDGSPDCIVVIG